ncbi:hypothetical protein MOMOMA043M_10470 [Morganella morganii]
MSGYIIINNNTDKKDKDHSVSAVIAAQFYPQLCFAFQCVNNKFVVDGKQQHQHNHSQQNNIIYTHCGSFPLK